MATSGTNAPRSSTAAWGCRPLKTFQGTENDGTARPKSASGGTNHSGCTSVATVVRAVDGQYSSSISTAGTASIIPSTDAPVITSDARQRRCARAAKKFIAATAAAIATEYGQPEATSR